MKTIGKTDRTWSVQKAIAEQAQKESWMEWAEKPTPKLVNNYKPQEFHLTEVAKHAFTRGISLFKL